MALNTFDFVISPPIPLDVLKESNGVADSGDVTDGEVVSAVSTV
jgi:hypothetical protein